MPQIAPFSGLRYDPDRIRIDRACISRNDATLHPAACLEKEPRCALRFEPQHPGAQLWRSELVRSGILVHDDEPAIYAVRHFAVAEDEGARDAERDADEDDAVFGFFALLANDEPLTPLSEPGPGLIECVVSDRKNKIKRVLRAATEERDPDLRLQTGARITEVYVVDDESTCARLLSRLETADAWQIRGPTPSGETLVYFEPDPDPQSNSVSGLHRILADDRDRADLLDAARAFFSVEESEGETARAAVTSGEAAALIDNHGAFILRLLPHAPVEAFDLHGLAADDTAADALISAAVRALTGPETKGRPGLCADVAAADGERLFLVPPPSFTDAGKRPAGTLSLLHSPPLGLVLR